MNSRVVRYEEIHASSATFLSIEEAVPSLKKPPASVRYGAPLVLRRTFYPLRSSVEVFVAPATFTPSREKTIMSFV